MKLVPTALLFGVALILVCNSLVSGSEFDEIDTNHNGVISREEWSTWKNKATNKVSEADTVGKKSSAKPAASSHEENGSDIIKWIERNFKIRESFLGAGSNMPPGISFASTASSEPARVGWTKPSNGSAFYQVDAAVLWQPPFLSSGTEWCGNSISWFVEPSFEAHISSEEGSTQDQLTYRSPLTLNFAGGKKILEGMDNLNAVPTKRFITVHTFIISPTYQTDGHNHTRAIEGELFYTPTIPNLALGIRQPVFGLTKVQFHWRPYLGFELGDYLGQEKGAGSASENSISRFVFRTAADLSLGERFSLTGSFISRIDLSGAGESFNYGEVSGQVFLDPTLPTDGEAPHFSIGITYQRGNDAPDFASVDSVNAWLGVRF